MLIKPRNANNMIKIPTAVLLLLLHLHYILAASGNLANTLDPHQQLKKIRSIHQCICLSSNHRRSFQGYANSSSGVSARLSFSSLQGAGTLHLPFCLHLETSLLFPTPSAFIPFCYPTVLLSSLHHFLFFPPF